MSHKKRASTALKSMGAAGLAAATIVSGLSFGPAAAVAGPAHVSTSASSLVNSERATTEPFQLIWRQGNSYLTQTNTSTWGAPKGFSTLNAAKLAGINYTYDPIAKRLYSGAGSLRLAGQMNNGSFYYSLGSTGDVADVSFPDGVLTMKRSGTTYRATATTTHPNGPTPQIVMSAGSALPIVSDTPNDSIRSLSAQVTNVNNSAKSAVISGTATPGAKVSIGSQETSANTTTGAWSITVTGLKVGRNDLTVIQKINGTEHDRKTVSPTIEADAVDFTALVTSVDHAAKSAVISGTAAPGSTIVIDEKTTRADFETGAWTITVTDLHRGPNRLYADRVVDGRIVETRSINVDINDAAITGQDGTAVTLERGAVTSVGSLFRSTSTISNPTGTVEFTAPEGTTFSEGQGTISGDVKDPGGAWENGSLRLTNGQRSPDGSKYTYSFRTESSFRKSEETLFRWSIDVSTPADAEAGTSPMTTKLTGTATDGAFNTTSTTATTIESGAVDLVANVTSVDHAAKTAVISGTATPGATVVIGEESVEADAETGAWSITVSDLERGKNTIHVVQEIDGEEHDSKDVDVAINDAAITGQDGTAVTLERGGVTSVESLFTTNGAVSRPQAKVEFTAPEGTTFPDGQRTLNGQYKLPNGDWKAFAQPLSNGTRSGDGTEYTYDLATSSSWRLADGAMMRWNINVTTPADAEAGTFPMTTKLVGTATEGAFNTTSTTATTIEAGSSELAPITLTGPASVTPGRSNTFTGTAEPGATYRVLNVSGTQIVPGTLEVDGDGKWTFDRVVSNGASNFRFVIEQTKNGQTAKSEIFTIDATTLAPITLSGPTSVRPGVSNTFTGKAEPGATYRVLNASGTQIVPGTLEVDGEGKWTFDRVVSNGASNFRFVIEQTKNGQTARSEIFTIDATKLTPVTVTAPERVTPGRSNTFTGTGEPGATFRVLNISGTQIVPGTHEVDAQGNWTFDRVVSSGASNFRFVIEQSKNGQTEKSEVFTIEAAGLAPVTVANRSVTPGVVNTFTGTGEPGASYRVLNITGTQIVPGTFEVDPQGNWTFDRAVSRGATEFRFALEQTKNGRTELSELFTLPADTK